MKEEIDEKVVAQNMETLLSYRVGGLVNYACGLRPDRSRERIKFYYDHQKGLILPFPNIGGRWSEEAMSNCKGDLIIVYNRKNRYCHIDEMTTHEGSENAKLTIYHTLIGYRAMRQLFFKKSPEKEKGQIGSAVDCLVQLCSSA